MTHKRTFRLVNKKVCPNYAAYAEAPPHEENFGSHVSLIMIDHIASAVVSESLDQRE